MTYHALTHVNRPIKPAKTLLATLICSALFATNSAQALDLLNTDGTQNSQDDELQIVITAGRQPQQLANTLATTEVITRKEIERRQSGDTVTLLESINGLNLQRSGGRGTVVSLFLRGTATAQTLVLVDGIRLNSTASGAPSLDTIPVDSIERVEVVKGPMSSLYGADAIGGVIHIITRKGDGQGQGQGQSASGQLDIASGSNATKRLRASTQLEFSQGHFALNMQQESTDGINAINSTSAETDLDPFEQRAGNISSTLYLNDNLKTQLNYLYSDSEIDFDDEAPTVARDYTRNILETASANITAQLNDALQVNLGASYLAEQAETFSDFARESDTTRQTATLQFNIQPNNNFNWIIGADHRDEEEESNDYRESRENNAAYTQATLTLNAFEFAVSGRTDHNQAYGNFNTHGFAAGYALTNDIRLTASYGEAFRAPTFADLYFESSFFIPNPDLQPEQAKTKELALRKDIGQQQWYITAFETQFEDLITYISDPATFIGTLDNINAAEIEGSEVGFTTAIDNNTTFNISAAYTDARDSNTRAFLDGRSHWNLFSELYWQADQFSWGVDFQGVQGKRSSGTTLASYGLIGAQARYQVDPKLALYADLDNIGDREYITRTTFMGGSYQNPGRTVLFGFDLSI